MSALNLTPIFDCEAIYNKGLIAQTVIISLHELFQDCVAF